jgi:hypothetical protein
LDEQFSGNADTNSLSRRRARQGNSFKRVRLRGDWSDTGPSAGMSRAAPGNALLRFKPLFSYRSILSYFADIGQARPTVHEGFMQRMADVLRSMTSLNSPSVASPSSPFENPTEDPSFPVAEANVSLANSNVRDDVNSRDEIDFVTYESLGRSENNPENQPENMDGGMDDSSTNYSDDRNESFPPFRNRQDSEQISNGYPVLRYFFTKSYFRYC